MLVALSLFLQIPFYAVLLGSKGSMITTKSKEAFKLCKHGAYRAGLTCGCYLVGGWKLPP